MLCLAVYLGICLVIKEIHFFGFVSCILSNISGLQPMNFPKLRSQKGKSDYQVISCMVGNVSRYDSMASNSIKAHLGCCQIDEWRITLTKEKQ